jgi:hypothetical protein
MYGRATSGKDALHIAWRTGLRFTSRGSDVPALFAVGLTWTLLWASTAPLGDFPVNDDWVYGSIVKNLLDTGRFSFPSPSSANVIVQVYWGALFCLPYGFSFAALRISTFVLATAGVLAVYLLLREIGGSRKTAAVGALTLAANPLYLHLAASFMTDIPFTALSLVALWAYMAGARRDNSSLIVAAYGVAFLATFIRQFGLILPIAFGAGILLRRGVGGRSWIFAVIPPLVYLFAQLGFEQWITATGRTPQLPVPIDHLIISDPATAFARVRRLLLTFVPYLGLFASPFVVWVAFTRTLTRPHPVSTPISWSLTGLLATALSVVLWAKGEFLPGLGNIILPFGLGPLTLRDTFLLHINNPVVTGADFFWAAATLLGAWSASVVGLLTVRAAFDVVRALKTRAANASVWRQGVILTAIALYVSGTLLLGAGTLIFDRYLLPLVAPLCALAYLGSSPRDTARRRPVWTVAIAPGLLVALAIASVGATHDYQAWSRARWAATLSLAAKGISPTRIDGGYEYNGLHLYLSEYRLTKEKSWWWVADDEYIVASGLIPGYAEVESFQFKPWLWPAHSSVLVLRRM